MSSRRLPNGTAGLVAGMLIAGSLITWSLVPGTGRGQQEAAPSTSDQSAIQQAKGLSRAFRSAAKQVLPTVVKVKTSTNPRQIRGPRRDNPFQGTPFEDFFDEHPYYGMPDGPRPGLGSGVIIDPSGIVLTNNHVVEDADKVTVQLGDGREFDAVEIKTDERSDLAVLRIRADASLPAARLGDSDQLEIGDWVLAVGNPFELEQTVSAGIISAKGRALDSVRRARFLQTDAAINPGNSGGPLVNLDGEVVAINTAIFSRTGGNQGIGFAIPINLAKWVTPQLIENGTVARAYLGVTIADVTPALSEQVGVAAGAGIVVGTVGEGSPADEAGIRSNDVITAFDGRPIRKVSDLQELVERSKADSRHEIRMLRDGKPQTVKVTVKAMPDDFEVAMGRGGLEGRRGSAAFFHDRQLGLLVIELTEAWARQLGYEGLSGALIMDVDAAGLAAQAGLREGNLIVRVGKTAVRSVAEFREAVEQEDLAEGIELEVKTVRGSTVVVLKKR